MKYLVSVILPVYNAEKTILNTIKSVVNQRCDFKFELIVVDDGSTDSSNAIIKNFLNDLPDDRGPKIQFVSTENNGVSSARNKGIELSSGSWISFIDSDDIWYPNKLEKQIECVLNNREIEIIGCNVVNECYPFFGKSKYEVYSLSVKEFIFKWYPSTPTVLISRKLIDKVGWFNEKLLRGEDVNLWLRSLIYCPIYVLNKELVAIGQGKKPYGDTGLSANLKEMHKGEMYNLTYAKEKKLISNFYYSFFYLWLKLKFLKRVVKTFFRKNFRFINSVR